MDKVLVVDDLPINREILKEIFRDQYDVIEASNGEEAIAVLNELNDEISLVCLDRLMPVLDGIAVLQYMRESDMIEYIPVIMITGEATRESDIQAYEYGASDIIYKPFEPTIIKKRARNIVELYRKRKSIEEQLAERTRELLESREQLAKNNDFLISALGNIVGYRSVESGEHIQRVKQVTKILAESVAKEHPEFSLTAREIDLISKASVLHDLGKIAIPDSILNKPGKLTNEEFCEMKQHTIFGCEILDSFKQEENYFYSLCYEICRWHHEKYDGKGYPDGLKGEEIPLGAQIVSVADCFDALVSERVYKPAYDFDTAIDMILNGECGAFSDMMRFALEDSRERLHQFVLANPGV